MKIGGGLPNGYLKYTKNYNVFLQLGVNRPTFCCCIYRTDLYKRIQYNPEKYGKLHDIIFMIEIGHRSNILILDGECVRWRQHTGSDSNTLKTGPFPKEIINILISLKDFYMKENGYTIIGRTLLFNFAFFLYNWSNLRKFYTWKEFKFLMKKNNIFNDIDYILFNYMIDSIFNPIIRKLVIKYREKIHFSYEYRVNGNIF